MRFLTCRAFLGMGLRFGSPTETLGVLRGFLGVTLGLLWYLSLGFGLKGAMRL
jgi:hypothetical protein